LASKPVEVGNDGDYELLPSWVLRSECRGKEIEKVASFFGSFMPICRWRRQQLRLQFVLPKVQVSGPPPRRPAAGEAR
jgi:hypothetical protein